MILHKNGLELRAVECSRCGDKIIHPADMNGLEHFKNLRQDLKDFKRVHIDRHFVLTFQYDKGKKFIQRKC